MENLSYLRSGMKGFFMEKQNLMQKILPLGVKLPATTFVHAEVGRSISIVTVKYKVKACITAHLEQFNGES